MEEGSWSHHKKELDNEVESKRCSKNLVNYCQKDTVNKADVYRVKGTKSLHLTAVSIGKHNNHKDRHVLNIHKDRRQHMEHIRPETAYGAHKD